jgi:hypothetical protein
MFLFCKGHYAACYQVAKGWAFDEKLAVQINCMMFPVPGKQSLKILVGSIFVCKIVDFADLFNESLFEWLIEGVVHVCQSQC